MASPLGASRLGAHERRAKERKALDERVKAASTLHKGRYGAPRMTRELGEQGHRHDEKTIACVRRQGLVARAAKRFKATTNSNHDLPVAPTLLNQDFTASGANEKWVQDMTYCGYGSSATTAW